MSTKTAVEHTRKRVTQIVKPSPFLAEEHRADFSRHTDILTRPSVRLSHYGAEQPSLGHDFSRIGVHSEAEGTHQVPQSCPLTLSSPRFCPFGGACHTCPTSVQTKLAIDRSGDQYEQEADRVAEAMVQVSKSQVPVGATDSKSARPSTAPPIVHEVLRSPSQPLDSATRAFMESRFACDFSKVRVHADAKASESARSVNALAYTVGHDVVFETGLYAPKTSWGKRLLAHELTHVIQQTRGLTARLHLQRLGANPGCSASERTTIHQAIFNARGWLNKAIPKLEATPLPDEVIASLRRNFGLTYGVAENAPLIVKRLRAAYREISTIPFSCAGAADATCATNPCGYVAAAGSHAATICSNVTLAPGTDWRYQAGCVLHESFHAAFSRFAVDEYSGWHGVAAPTAGYPGGGVDPLLNADSYTTLVMDLS